MSNSLDSEVLAWLTANVRRTAPALESALAGEYWLRHRACRA